jgi:hypothetical protein
LGTVVQIFNSVFVMKLFKRKREPRLLTDDDDDYPALNGGIANSVEEGVQNPPLSYTFGGASQHPSSTSANFTDEHLQSANTQYPPL